MKLTKRTIGTLAVPIVVIAGVLTVALTLGNGSVVPKQVVNQAQQAAKEARHFDIHGTLTIGYPCTGWGYSDLTAGVQVVVFNSKRDVVGTGTLEPSAGSSAEYLAGCEFRFDVYDVPTGLKRYGVQVGNANRGVIWHSEAEARKGFYLTIG